MTRGSSGRRPQDEGPARPARDARSGKPRERESAVDPRLAVVRQRLREGRYEEPPVLAEVARRLLLSGALQLPGNEA